ncbi:hypothetical protein F5Y13DRAFT_151140 [Hypoxylon sp. FL1857]|nr:hypothetical protein F5Y13DRAFT_151140 [Hypoxylon sp. FL1857]
MSITYAETRRGLLFAIVLIHSLCPVPCKSSMMSPEENRFACSIMRSPLHGYHPLPERKSTETMPKMLVIHC